MGETRKARGNYLMMFSLMGLYDSLMMGVAIAQSIDVLASVHQLQPIEEFGLTSRLEPSLQWVQFIMLSTRGWTERTLMDKSGLGQNEAGN